MRTRHNNDEIDRTGPLYVKNETDSTSAIYSKIKTNYHDRLDKM